MISFGFTSAHFLYWLLLLPLFVLIYFLSLFYNKRKSINFPNFEALQRIGLTDIHSKNVFYLMVFILILSCFILSLSGMWVSFDANTSEYSYVIAIDSSGSMRANDLLPNRLTASKNAIKDLVVSLPLGTKVGLITFSGDVKILSPVISKEELSLSLIDGIDFSEISGTNIKDAVEVSNELIKITKLKSLILVSDGQINLGNFSEIIVYAQKNDLVINTFAIGTVEGGDTGQGFISKTDIDALKSLAFNTGGRYFSVTSNQDLNPSFKELISNTNATVKINISNYLLMAGLILLAIYWILYNFRFRNFP